MGTETLVTQVVLTSAVIIGLGFVLGRLFARFGQPEVVGQIFAGIALGPAALGQLAPDLASRLIPEFVVPYLTVFAQIPLVLFLFAIGYELDLRVLGRQRRTVPLVSLSAFAIPMVLGAGLALALVSRYAAGHQSAAQRGSFILFMAVALSVTAVPVLAGIVREKGMAGTRPGVVALTSAGVIDAAGWLALAGAVLLGGSNTAADRPLVITFALFAGYLLIMMFVVRPVLVRWLRRPRALVRSDVPVVAVFALGSAWATAAIGLHVIFGAFVAGLMMPRTADGVPDVALVRPLQDAGALLIPLFFVVAGLPVTFTGMRFVDAAFVLLICLVAIAGKFGGGMIGARLSGMSRRDATMVGIMLNTRGLTELIALNIGLQAGIIDQRLYTMLLIMALVTTMLTGPLLSLVRYRSPAELPTNEHITSRH